MQLHISWEAKLPPLRTTIQIEVLVCPRRRCFYLSSGLFGLGVRSSFSWIHSQPNVRIQGVLSSFRCFSEALWKQGFDSSLESEVRGASLFHRNVPGVGATCISKRQRFWEWILVHGCSGPPSPPSAFPWKLTLGALLKSQGCTCHRGTACPCLALRFVWLTGREPILQWNSVNICLRNEIDMQIDSRGDKQVERSGESFLFRSQFVNRSLYPPEYPVWDA